MAKPLSTLPAIVSITLLGIVLSVCSKPLHAQITWMDWPSPDEERPS